MVQKYGVFPAVFREAGGQFAIWFDHPADRPFRVDACGAACLLIRRHALEAMRGVLPGRWWDHLLIDGDKPLGEDLSFCARAAAAGIPIWAEPTLDVKHNKVRVALDREVCRQYRESKSLIGNLWRDDGVHS